MAKNTVPWRTLNGRSEATAKESNDVSIATEKWYRSAGTISAHGVEINGFVDFAGVTTMGCAGLSNIRKSRVEGFRVVLGLFFMFLYLNLI